MTAQGRKRVECQAALGIPAIIQSREPSLGNEMPITQNIKIAANSAQYIIQVLGERPDWTDERGYCHCLNLRITTKPYVRREGR